MRTTKKQLAALRAELAELAGGNAEAERAINRCELELAAGGVSNPVISPYRNGCWSVSFFAADSGGALFVSVYLSAADIMTPAAAVLTAAERLQAEFNSDCAKQGQQLLEYASTITSNAPATTPAVVPVP